MTGPIEYCPDPEPTEEQINGLLRWHLSQPVAYRLGPNGMWAHGNLIDEGASVVRLLFAKSPRWEVVSFLLRNGQVVHVRRKP